ncbi:MAG: hypothetical protein ACK4J0_01845 [Candidatus Anstonellaceae archaeon]
MVNPSLAEFRWKEKEERELKNAQIKDRSGKEYKPVLSHSLTLTTAYNKLNGAKELYGWFLGSFWQVLDNYKEEKEKQGGKLSPFLYNYEQETLPFLQREKNRELRINMNNIENRNLTPRLIQIYYERIGKEIDYTTANYIYQEIITFERMYSDVKNTLDTINKTKEEIINNQSIDEKKKNQLLSDLDKMANEAVNPLYTSTFIQDYIFWAAKDWEKKGKLVPLENNDTYKLFSYFVDCIKLSNYNDMLHLLNLKGKDIKEQEQNLVSQLQLSEKSKEAIKSLKDEEYILDYKTYPFKNVERAYNLIATKSPGELASNIEELNKEFNMGYNRFYLSTIDDLIFYQRAQKEGFFAPFWEKHGDTITTAGMLLLSLHPVTRLGVSLYYIGKGIYEITEGNTTKGIIEVGGGALLGGTAIKSLKTTSKILNGVKKFLNESKEFQMFNKVALYGFGSYGIGQTGKNIYTFTKLLELSKYGLTQEEEATLANIYLNTGLAALLGLKLVREHTQHSHKLTSKNLKTTVPKKVPKTTVPKTKEKGTTVAEGIKPQEYVHPQHSSQQHTTQHTTTQHTQPTTQHPDHKLVSQDHATKDQIAVAGEPIAKKDMDKKEKDKSKSKWETGFTTSIQITKKERNKKETK